MNLEEIRKDFPVLERKKNGRNFIYLDNAATSLKPKLVINAMNEYYENVSANVHRGLHALSEEASREYEEAHKSVARFVNARKEETILTSGTTEGLNLVMYSLYNSNYFKRGDKILVSQIEHHSNIVPWQFLERKIGVQLEFIKINENYEIDYSDFEKKAKNSKLVSITGASNTVATIPDLREAERIAHSNGALFCVDGAQLIPHQRVDFKRINADFLAFSGHKMLGPTGSGALIAKKELLEKLEPFKFGGDMIKTVSEHNAVWNDLPYKYEAGTPLIGEAYGLKAAIEYLEKIGLDNIKRHEEKITKIAIEELSRINGIKLFCPMNEKKQGSIVLFGAEKLSAHDLALALSETENICIRSGMHCAEPIVSKLNKDGLARASFYLYNTEEEIIKFAKALKEIMQTFS